jgi:ATP-dependent RNA helicase RhlE
VDEEIFLRDIQRLIHKEIAREVVRGFEPDPNEKAEPIVLGRMTIGVGANRRGGHNGSGARPARAPQGRAPNPGHASRAHPPLHGTHAPRDARAPQGQKPAQAPRPGARPGGGAHGASVGARPPRGGRGR